MKLWPLVPSCSNWQPVGRTFPGSLTRKAEIMSKQRPFTWTVVFSVAPLWVADGFALTDERALQMAAEYLPHADVENELTAKVIHAPSAADIATVQGYQNRTTEHGRQAALIRQATPHIGDVHAALIEAQTLLDSVAFVSVEGDTGPVLRKIRKALKLIDARQGRLMEVDQ